MLVHATVEKLTAMHLAAMAEAFQRQLASTQFAELSFEDRVGMLVDQEWTAREQRKLQRRLQSANLRHQALARRHRLAGAAPRTRQGARRLPRHVRLDPAAPESGDHRADRHRQVLAGRRLRRARVPRWLLRLPRARPPAAARPRRRPRGWLLHAAPRQARQDRAPPARRLGPGPAHGTPTARHPRGPGGSDRARLHADHLAQLPIKAWHEAIGEPTLADSICDRLVHTAHVLDLQGPSLRDPKVRSQRSHPDLRPTAPERAHGTAPDSATKEAKRPTPKHRS